MTEIGFVGLGFLGGTLARSASDSGFDTLLYDAHEMVQSFTGRHVKYATSLGAVARASDMVGVCIVGDAAVEDAVGGPEGLLNGPMQPGSVIALHSAVRPVTCSRLHEKAAALGVGLIDAPVITNRDRATRTIVVAGDAGTYQRYLPVLLTMASEDHVLYLGPVVGSAEVVKLLNNLLMVVNMGAATVALKFGERLGVARAVMESTLTNGSGRSQGLDTLLKFPRRDSEPIGIHDA